MDPLAGEEAVIPRPFIFSLFTFHSRSKRSQPLPAGGRGSKSRTFPRGSSRPCSADRSAPHLVLSAVLPVSPSRAALADDPLPKADDVLDQFVEATGGKAAYEKIKNRVSKGTMEISG